MDYLFKRTFFTIKSFIPHFYHQMMIEIFRLPVSNEYLVKNGKIIIFNKYSAKIKYQVFYHILILYDYTNLFS